MNINISEIFTENGMRYTYLAIMYSIAGDINSTTLDGSEEGHQTILPIGNTIEVKINNSLSSPVLTGSIIFRDEGGILTNFIGSTHSFCDINFQLVDGQGNPSSAAFLHKFWVESIDIISIDSPSVHTVKINLLSIHWYTFLSTIKYFQKDPYPGTTHISNLISLSGLRSTKTVVDYRNNAAPFPFLLPANWSVLDGIYYCLNKMVEINESLYFVVYNPVENNYFSWRLSDSNLNQAISVETGLNFAILNTKNSFSKSTSLTLDNFELKNYSPTHKILQFAKDQINFVYNYNSGEWTKSNISATNIIKNSLYGGNINSTNVPPGYDTKVKPFPSNISGSLQNTLNSTEWSKSNPNTSLWKKLRDFFCTHNILTFKCQGVLDRTPGINFYIDGDLKSLENLGVHYGLLGKWTTLQVSHIITPNSYKNEISLGRPTYLKNISTLIESSN